MSSAAKYIKLVALENVILSKAEKDILQNIRREIRRTDIYIEYENKNVILYLNRIDLKGMKVLNRLLQGTALEEILISLDSVKGFGVRDGKRIYVDWDTERKVHNRKEKEANRRKYFYTDGHDFSQENNCLPDIFLDEIITGDSEAVLKKLPENCIDLIFTSPPYNFGLDYNQQIDEHYWERYFDKLFSILKESIRVLKFGGRCLINIQPLYSDYIPSHHLISQYFMKEKMIWKGEILWEKNNYNCKYTSWGSWKSPASPYLKYTWEFIEVFCKGDIRKPGDKDKIDIGVEEFKEWVVAKWPIPPEKKMKRYDHPAMFPEELVDRVLKLFSYQGDIVLDPFNGAGTTTAIAKKLQRRYLGIDISEEYNQQARRRLQEIYSMNTGEMQ